jgi:C4-type Zn-finger protein
MSDTGKLADSVDAKLRQKGAKHECPICTNKTWYLIGNEARSTIIPFVSALDSIETYTFACQRCGFVRQHLKVVVDGGLKQIDQERSPNE